MDIRLAGRRHSRQDPYLYPFKMTYTTSPAGVHAKSFIQNSIALPPQTYECDEYFSRFKPRIHQDAGLADAGSWQCQLDFLESSHAARAGAARNVLTKSYAVGCINPIVGNFTALCACEAIPERLSLTTYMVEYAYIHDDGKWTSDPARDVLLTQPQQSLNTPKTNPRIKYEDPSEHSLIEINMY